jgi:hypothetical protein
MAEHARTGPAAETAPADRNGQQTSRTASTASAVRCLATLPGPGRLSISGSDLAGVAPSGGPAQRAASTADQPIALPPCWCERAAYSVQLAAPVPVALHSGVACWSAPVCAARGPSTAARTVHVERARNSEADARAMRTRDAGGECRRRQTRADGSKRHGDCSIERRSTVAV